jgi:hypothetical protein
MKTQKFLTSLFLIVSILFIIPDVYAQTDTVCAGQTGKAYWVTGTSGSTFSWIVAGGTQASGANTNSITVDFATSTGTDTIKVVETSSSGCIGDTMYLAIVRMPLPTATISGTTAMCFNDSTDVIIDLTGTGEWTFTYTDGTNPVTVNAHALSQYSFNTGVLSAATTTYTITAVSDRLGCTGTGSGSAVITVNPKPNTSQIQF